MRKSARVPTDMIYMHMSMTSLGIARTKKSPRFSDDVLLLLQLAVSETRTYVVASWLLHQRQVPHHCENTQPQSSKCVRDTLVYK